MRLEDARARADRDLDEIYFAGLTRRLGTLLIPPAIVNGRIPLDWVLYETIRKWRDRWRSAPGALPPRAPTVCEGCHAVFRPAVKRFAALCLLCEKRRPAAIAGMTRDWEGVPLRAPKTVGHAITGWHTFYAFRGCEGCGEPFVAKDRTAECCSAKCRQRKRRTGQ